MSLSEYAKAAAGRWMDRHYLPPTPPTADTITPTPPVFDPDGEEDGTGMWLPAGLVDVYDEVSVAGRWHRVSGTSIGRPDYNDPGWAELWFAGGWSQRTGFMSRVYCRDVAAQISAQIGGAQ